MTWLWIVLAFAAGAATCWYASGHLLKLAFRRSMMVDIIKGLRTETVITLREEADKEIARRKQLLAEKARVA